ncbi:mersacidin/lichenicidin family type 2 lantibiotic [Myxococcota bacterium]|nr:mersacidin/lichenicidin family type 2 lantibiotic [Myxococcota bacterium]
MKAPSTTEQIRAWKDPAHRKTLSAEDQARLAPSPAGEIDVRDLEARAVEDSVESARGRTPEALMSQGTSGGTQCSAHGCPGVELPEIRINPAARAKRAVEG